MTAGKYDNAKDPGDTAHLQALTTALSGTVGTGNIGGVGLAVFFAVAAVICAFGTGNLPQSNNIAISVQVFTGSAASGGFLGASFAYAFNRGVNKGLFSNEAGQGSAPIAHAAAKVDEHVSEGMVSLLEPFIDTLVICTITGLVILSSGAWAMKFENDFQQADMLFLEGNWSDQSESDTLLMRKLLVRGSSDAIRYFDGTFAVAENLRFSRAGQVFYRDIVVVAGKMVDSSVTVSGLSLVDSVALTRRAFSFGFSVTRGNSSSRCRWCCLLSHERCLVLLRGSRHHLPGRTPVDKTLPHGVLHRIFPGMTCERKVPDYRVGSSPSPGSPSMPMDRTFNQERLRPVSGRSNW